MSPEEEQVLAKVAAELREIRQQVERLTDAVLRFVRVRSPEGPDAEVVELPKRGE